jgi:aspartyl-tRNA(Asn)/glutamyl-tRNA(Gln) amidotransferase subunit C
LANIVKTIFYRGAILLEMANLSKDDVLHLAKLARLHLTDEEIEQFQGEISAILGYVEQLQNVDLGGLEPTYQVTGLTNVMRPDQEIDYGASPEELLKNAPATEDGQIKVKRMLA